MRVSVVIISFLLLVCASVCSAQPIVVIDSMTGGLCGEPHEYASSTHYISICNPDVVQERLALFFTITADGGYRDVPEVEFYNRFDSLWLATNYSNHNCFNQNFYEIDSYTYQLAVFVPDLSEVLPGIVVDGLPVSSDTIPYIGIRVRPESLHPQGGIQLCIDSVTNYSDYTWSAYPGPTPVFAGEKCWDIGELLPNTCCWVDPVISVNGVFQYGVGDTAFSIPDDCSPLEIAFREDIPHPELMPQANLEWYISGPGSLEYDVQQDFWVYSFHPDVSQSNQTFGVALYPNAPYCETTVGGIGPQFNVAVGEITGSDDPVRFVYSQPANYAVLSGDTLRVTMPVEDDGPCYNHEYSFHISPEDPLPPGASINSETGEVTYVGAPADTGKYWIYVDVTEGESVHTKYFMISHFDQVSCGDCDHNGTIDVGDLTWMINFLFMNGPAPIPEDAGDVDCVPGIDVADLTAVIEHLFITYDPLCDGCER